jgi:acetylxylan esterase
MIRYTLAKYGGDPARVFSTGSSSGCAMTMVMAATYPDLLAACTCYSGAAAGCLKDSPGYSPQSMDPTCAQGKNVKTAAEWASLARSMYPAWKGGYPRMATWHGTADWLSSYLNLGEEIKQWSALLDVRFSRNESDMPEKGYTKIVFGEGDKFVAYSGQDVGHTVPVHAVEDLKWFGLY